jgi:hypothetical protein
MSKAEYRQRDFENGLMWEISGLMKLKMMERMENVS